MRPVRGDGFVLKVPVPNDPVSFDVVAVSPPESEAFVPQANPRTVALVPPVAVIFPFSTAVVAVTEEAD
ncbi:MAG: hypothetical protein WC767_00380 [Candidatus Paceibacterota bacterium]